MKTFNPVFPPSDAGETRGRTLANKVTTSRKFDKNISIYASATAGGGFLRQFRISITFTHTFDRIGVFLGKNKQHPSPWVLLVWAEAMPGGFGAEKCCQKCPDRQGINYF